MHNSVSVSNCIRLLLACCFLAWETGACAQQERILPLAQYERVVILPSDEENKADVRWADYFYRQASNRADKQVKVSAEKTGMSGELTIDVHLLPSETEGYSVDVKKDRISLTASSEQTMLWMVYQCLACMAQSDNRWNAADLEPPLMELVTSKRTFDFQYRSIYSPSLSDPDRVAITDNRHVDYHWGLWGHNLRKVFGGKIPEEAQAVVDGKRTTDQFCFSSEVLADALESYISDSYGEGHGKNTAWFAIMPNDNAHVCMCDRCRQQGNQPNSATPAVTGLLRRLASRFPGHEFYTSAYATTVAPPRQKLPANAGVIISAINLPLQPAAPSGKASEEWRSRLLEWKKVTEHVIVWDYMRNFDDYLTPFPCLGSIRSRLQWFKELGVAGVFYNGSGDDYASFDDVQTYVISSMLKDTDIEPEPYVRSYLHHFYPVCGKLMADYYCTLEKRVKERGCRLEWYEGIGFAAGSYLDPEEFRAFYDTLDRESKKAGEEERARLNKLLTALNFTRLELLRLETDRTEDASTCLELLEGYRLLPGLTVYKEANGRLDDYLEEWNNRLLHAGQKTSGRRVKIAVSEQTEVPDASRPLPMLTDDCHGFAHDYHTHWYISPQKQLRLQLAAPSLRHGKLVLTFLHAPVWKIGQPSAVEVYSKEALLARWKDDGKEPAGFSVTKVEIDVDGDIAGRPLEIRITGGNQPKIACDEIEWYEKDN